MDGLEADLRPGEGPAARARLHHHLLASDRRQRRADHRQLRRAGLQPDAHRERARRHPGLRHEVREVHVEVPRDSAARRVRPRDVGERRVEVDRRHFVVGADVGRPRAWSRLHPDQRRDDGLLRRVPAGRQPVQHDAAGAGRQDRQAGLAPPAGEARHLELRRAQRAGVAGRERQRPAHPRRVHRHQAVVGLLLQPSDGTADLAVRGTARAAVRRSRPRNCRRRRPTSPNPRRSISRGGRRRSSSTTRRR